MGEAKREGLRAAGDVIAHAMRVVAGVKTRQTARAVNTTFEGEDLLVRAGRPEGHYGWEPIQALMFDDNRRHPLFGNKRKWYHQGEYPITDATVALSVGRAVEAYADTAVDLMLKEHGFPE